MATIAPTPHQPLTEVQSEKMPKKDTVDTSIKQSNNIAKNGKQVVTVGGLKHLKIRVGTNLVELKVT